MSLESRFELVLARESGVAKAVAKRVVDKPLLSAWMIVLPIIFVQYMISSRDLNAVARAFAREFMLTKRLALEMAREMAENGTAKEAAVTACLSAEWPDEVEPARMEIRERQRTEVDLLVDHYGRLLAADGDSFPSLVKNAYRDRDDYAAFLERLYLAEREVNGAAVDAFGETEDFKETCAKAEAAARELRQAELDLLFPAT
jgi:hypothetical protein